MSESGVSIGNLEIGTRASICLANAGIKTVDELCSWSRARLFLIPNMGSKSVGEVVSALRAHGRWLSDMNPPMFANHPPKFPPGVAVVGLTTFKDRLFVATTEGVYEMVNEELVPVPFKEIPEEKAQGPVDLGGHSPSCEAAQMHVNPKPHKLYICSCGRV